jgi:hypothetical protein
MNEQELNIPINEVMKLSESIYNRLTLYKEAHLTPGTTTSILELNHVHQLSEILLEKMDNLISH